MEKSNQLPEKGPSKIKKFFSWLILIVLIVLAGAFYWKYYFVFGDGVKTGELNFAVKKGNLFKTYEGKLIQTGLRTQSASTGLSNNEFEFSIESDSIYQILTRNSGKIFDLHYKEYKGVIPWRGNSRYIVDEIVEMREPTRSGF
ncbi:hypothetical protein [Sphingobacterium kyonggiense]